MPGEQEPNIDDAAKKVVDAAKDSPKDAEQMLRQIMSTLEERHWSELKAAIQEQMSALPQKVKEEAKLAVAEALAEFKQVLSALKPSEGQDPLPNPPPPGPQVTPPQDSPPPSSADQDAPAKTEARPRGWLSRVLNEKR